MTPLQEPLRPDTGPSTISDVAQAFLRAEPLPARKLETLEDWLAIRSQMAAMLAERNAELRQRHVESVEVVKIGGVPVHVITPKEYDPRNDATALCHLHGGAYVFGSAESSYLFSVPIAARLGLRVYSVDYRLAPEHPFPAGLDDSVAVYQELVKKISPARIGVFGESAGGSLLLSMLLKANKLGSGFPAAAVCISPWSDVGRDGDTYETLAGLDPVLGNYARLAPAVQVYARDTPLSDPLLSPVHASYPRGFPPTLIQTGTRDLFLSNGCRLYHKMKAEGVPAELSVWEGMWHGFSGLPPVDFPEQQGANDEIASFLGKAL